jgi:S-adenosylmethionine/arginine decarboxylase-like enzyme/uncharacterized protein with PQ loop repeat
MSAPESSDPLMDAIGYLGGVFLAVCTLPQLWHMYKTQSASDLQKRFLILYLAGCLLTFAYLVKLDAWAAWVTMTVEVYYLNHRTLFRIHDEILVFQIFLTLFTLFYKIYLDYRSSKSIFPSSEGMKQNSAIIDLSNLKICASLIRAEFDNDELPVNHQFTSLTDTDLSYMTPPSFFPDSRFRGFHILLDYSGFEAKDPGELSVWTMRTIQAALKANEIRCVHSHSEVFDDVKDAQTPPGFTAVCLLDESHVSAHCYSAIGLLAIDVFTCGGKPNQTFAAARDIHRAVMDHLPCSFMGSSTFRFPYRIGPPMSNAESC